MKEIPPAIFPYHAKHNPNASSAYHVGHKGHSIEDCWVFKAKVQELIEQKILTFTKEGPNIKTKKGECSH